VSLLSTFSEEKFKYSVSTLEDSVTCNISLSEVLDLANQNGRFAMGLIKKCNHATNRIIGDMLKVRQKRLSGRIAYLLLYFAEHVYKSPIFDMPISRKEMAEYIGMTIENVIRALSDFRRDKLIKINGKSIEIIDAGMLKQISEKG
jgi:CRP/FNR family transcriptional regulator